MWHPKRPRFQQPKTLHRTMLARTKDLPFVHQMHLAMGPTLLHSPVSSSHLQKIFHLENKTMANEKNGESSVSEPLTNQSWH
jgi:hypothetical protein